MCVKKVYPNSLQCKKAIQDFKNGSRKHIPTRFYWCEECNGFHLTSKSNGNKLRYKREKLAHIDFLAI